MLHAQQQHSFSPLDLNILSMLTADGAPPTSPPHAHPHPTQTAKSKQSDRRPPVDPLMVAAAASAGPDITRNHYLHEFFPHTLAYASCDDERPLAPSAPRPKMQSQQAPRRVRLATEAEERRQQEQKQGKDDAVPQQPASSATAAVPIPGASSNPVASPGPTATTAQVSSPSSASARRLSVSNPDTIKLLRQPLAASPTSPSRSAIPLPATGPASLLAAAAASSPAPSSLPPLVVKCEVRTRIPTPHGHIFLHLYSNNHDSKEHLAFVADQAQMDAVLPADVGTPSLPFLRSVSLDSEWREGETEMERIVRGAYVGRLSASTIHPSTSPSSSNAPLPSTSTSTNPEPPLVRIHSECFTGEVIGSQRCDCGEQLDEAFRLITLHQRGVVVYLRQEGRGIGLLEKMRAYNLQDLGHDTVTANLMLGHGADMRTYDIAGAILRDLKVAEVRLLTNNPDKIEQIEKEGVKVVERVAMVPRSWIPSSRPSKKRKGGRRPPPRMSGAALLQQGLDSMASSMASSVLPSSDESYSEDDVSYTDDSEAEDDDEGDSYSSDSDASHNLRRSGVGMIGASVTRSAELEKYLRTKIERMGHMLEAPTTPIDSAPASRSESPAPSSTKKHRKPKMSRTASTASATAAGKPHPLASSVVSVAPEQEAAECGSGCEECK